MNANTKLEIAKEIIASQIGKSIMDLGLTIKDKELQQLMDLKDRIDRCDMAAINHVLKVSKKMRGNAND